MSSNEQSNQRIMSLMKTIGELTPQIVFCLGSMNTTDKWYKELDEVCKPMIHLGILKSQDDNTLLKRRDS